MELLKCFLLLSNPPLKTSLRWKHLTNSWFCFCLGPPCVQYSLAKLRTQISWKHPCPWSAWKSQGRVVASHGYNKTDYLCFSMLPYLVLTHSFKVQSPTNSLEFLDNWKEETWPNRIRKIIRANNIKLSVPSRHGWWAHWKLGLR